MDGTSRHAMMQLLDGDSETAGLRARLGTGVATVTRICPTRWVFRNMPITDDQTVTLLRVGSQVVGSLVDLQRGQGKRFAGLFIPGPDFETYRSLFENAVTAFQAIDEATGGRYQEQWTVWADYLKEINALELRMGETGIPIENFEIDGKCRVQFDLALWWQVETESTSP